MRVAIVGQGVIGCSTALAILEANPKAAVTLFSDRPFENTCSFGPAGLFRLDAFGDRKLAAVSFERFAQIERKYPGSETGVKLVSGHIQSDNEETLKKQAKNMEDIVYNFRWLKNREITALFPDPSKYCIHYTAYASEGRRYVPWLRRQATERGAIFISRKVSSLDDLADEGPYDAVVNCAGLDGGRLAGDDDTVIPSRGVAIEVEAPWHKHFNYRDFSTFTIPMVDSVIVGTVRHDGNASLEVTDADRDDIWGRYVALHPTMKGAKVLSEWCGLRPARQAGVRIEATEATSPGGNKFLKVHNYGHGSNGFTLGWGSALEVLALIQGYVKA